LAGLKSRWTRPAECTAARPRPLEGTSPRPVAMVAGSASTTATSARARAPSPGTRLAGNLCIEDRDDVRMRDRGHPPRLGRETPPHLAGRGSGPKRSPPTCHHLQRHLAVEETIMSSVEVPMVPAASFPTTR
jgi:hypothetical protein